MFDVDSAGNFYFVYSNSVYIFEQSGKRKAVLDNIVDATIFRFETYPDA
jgi:hypothetical protein